MTITAKVICDSISFAGHRLTTMQLRYPKFIHGEFMTHRVFSRNASSSRAIPVERMIEDIERDPAVPVFWGSNKPGMQAGGELAYEERAFCEGQWKLAAERACGFAELMTTAGLHKQIANRVLEPFMHINVIVTATNYSNFFVLRRHKDAQPEIQALANAMHAAMVCSHPKELQPGQWHLPYVNEVEDRGRILDTHDCYRSPKPTLIKLSVARCARVSYLTHEGKTPTIEEDIALYDRLVGSHPMHASPAEHQATPDEKTHFLDLSSGSQTVSNQRHLWGNFTGWIQYRKTLEYPS